MSGQDHAMRASGAGAYTTAAPRHDLFALQVAWHREGRHDREVLPGLYVSIIVVAVKVNNVSRRLWVLDHPM
jgi:hypothetical protein